MDYATEILKDTTYQALVDEIEALETDRIYCRHGMAHVMDVCRLSWNFWLEDVCLLQGESGWNRPAPEFMETFRDRMFVVGLLHDIGRGVQYKTGEHHARAGARLADEILTRLQYPQEWREQAVEIIRCHCGRKSGISKTEAWSSFRRDTADEEMADCGCDSENAGLLIAYYIRLADHLSRPCFCCKAADTCKWTAEERNRRLR